MYIAIVTFNEREAAAIDNLFDLIIALGSQWYRLGANSIYAGIGARTLIIQHHSLNSQGNVVAATSLAQLFTEESVADFVIFYGCAGVVDSTMVDQVFLVAAATYASLGTVLPGTAVPLESVTLKN